MDNAGLVYWRIDEDMMVSNSDGSRFRKVKLALKVDGRCHAGVASDGAVYFCSDYFYMGKSAPFIIGVAELDEIVRFRDELRLDELMRFRAEMMENSNGI